MSAKSMGATHPYLPGIVFLTLTALAYLTAPQLPPSWYYHWLCLSFAAAFAGLLIVEVLCNRPYADAASGLTPLVWSNAPDDRRHRRLLLKATGVLVLLAIASVGAATFYVMMIPTATLPPPWVFGGLVAVILTVVAIVDRFQRRRYDGLWLIGMMTIAGRPRLIRRQRAWRYAGFALLQGFFVTFGLHVLSANADFYSELMRSDLRGTTFILVSFSTYVDLSKSMISVGGFICCTRLLNNHVRTLDRSVISWVITLACYPPFFNWVDRSVGGLYRAHQWDSYFSPNSTAYNLYAAVLILFGLLYASDMLVWGTRFSNLAYRGLIASGPFAFVRHPAYLTKVSYFWLAGFPLFADESGGVLRQMLQLTFTSVLYFVRSRLEDRHLRMHAEYRKYENGESYSPSLRR